MMKERIFKNVVANSVLLFAIMGVFFIGFAGDIRAVITNTNGAIKAHYSGDTTKSNVSLMFNVYGGTEYLSGIMDTLEQKGVKATFFIGGVWAAKNEDSLNSIYERGHELGNHGYLHLDHKKLSKQRNREEIDLTQRLVENVTGFRTTLFAPPSGSYSKTTLEVAAELGYQTIMWSADTIDWRDQDEQLILSRVNKKLGNGTLVLMHPTKATLSALPTMIDNILAKGYQITIVSQNIIATN